ncbi:MAG: hypothetical protein AAGH41_06905 [Pseudomonadota bacterium]
MTKLALPLLALAASVTLTGCVIDAGDDSWSEKTTLAERTRLAREACGDGNVAEVNSKGFECKTQYRP